MDIETRQVDLNRKWGLPLKDTIENGRETGFAGRRDVAVILSGVLFLGNFFCLYFIWLNLFPEITGIMRIAFCWVGAYALTWFMTYVARGWARLILALIMIGVQYVIFHYQP